MSHVRHAQDRPRIHRRYRRAQAFAYRQRAADVAGAADILREDRECVLAAGRHDDVEGFRRCDAEFLDRHRMHVLPIHRDHGHRQAGDAHVEVGHRRAVDDAQPHPVAGREQTGPVAQRRGAVDQIGVGVRVDVGQIGRRHPHLAPQLAILQRGAETVATRVAQEIAHRALAVVVVAGHFLQPRVQIGGRQVGPVAEQHHMIALIVEGFGFGGVDDQRAVQAGLFLETGMAVIPVRTRLAQVETVAIGFARADAVETHARHAVHVRRQQDAVPVDRGLAAVDRVRR